MKGNNFRINELLLADGDMTNQPDFRKIFKNIFMAAIALRF